MTVLVLFPGKTDEATYGPITEELKKNGVSFELRLASAHKSPALVEEIIAGEFSLIISGAGLAAALPGVIAAKKIIPVLGVPCPGAYDGLDAFLSIVQMPPGVPVLMVSAADAAFEAGKILSQKEKVAVVGAGKTAEKARAMLDDLGIGYEMGDVAADAVNIVVVPAGAKVEKRDELIVYCPQGEPTAADAVLAMKAAAHGLWVGVNRGENAAIAVAQILGKKNELLASRKKFEEKCRKQDEEVRR
jgi:5-(carboxyamino)imidazole ribonucleotide mutase